jgi:hypothetical protein
VVTAYLKAVEAGQAGTRDNWLTRYPHLAADLQVFFDDQEEMERLAGPLPLLARAVREAITELGLSEQTVDNTTSDPPPIPHGDVGDYELLEEIAGVAWARSTGPGKKALTGSSP